MKDNPQLDFESQFQEILVVSKSPSWRTVGLQAAAKHTGLDLETPKQSEVTGELVAAFQKLGLKGDGHPGPSEAYNWLAHLNLVKYVLAHDLDTALIIEDDVDWDVTVKDQMRKLSGAIRGFTNTDAKDKRPYGRSWDILWIGHCGEQTEKSTDRKEYDDESVPQKYSGGTNNYWNNLTPGKRAVHRSINPLCTFGYGITRGGAEKILKWAGRGRSEAYDVRLMKGCKEEELSCLSVVPELMHHYTPPLTDVNGMGSLAEEDFERVMGNTANIVNSARCRTLFDQTCQRKY